MKRLRTEPLKVLPSNQHSIVAARGSKGIERIMPVEPLFRKQAVVSHVPPVIYH
jgi:hypothetical protein